jgi:hypothetical protein
MEDIDFARWSGFMVGAGDWFFSRAAVLRFDGLGLPFLIKAIASRRTGSERAGGLAYPDRFSTSSFCLLLPFSVF